MELNHKISIICYNARKLDLGINLKYCLVVYDNKNKLIVNPNQ